MLKRFGAMALVCLAATTASAQSLPADQRGEHRKVPVGSLPTCNAARKGLEIWTTGLNSTAACTGTGSAETFCACDGSAWQVRPGASGSVPDGNKGEVTVTGGAWSINDNVADHPPTFANTTVPGSMNCAVVGTVHIQTNATPPLESVCIATGTPGTWAARDATSSGTAANTTVACSRVGQLYVETDNSPPSLHICTVPGAAGAATWVTVNSPAGMFGSGGVLSCAINGCTITTNTLTGSMMQDSTITNAKIQSLDYSKIAAVPTDRVLCRDSATTGAAEACSLDPTLDLSGSQVLRRAAISGDVVVPLGSNTATVQPDSVALGTDTTGNYADGTAQGGAATSGDDAGGFFPTGTMEHSRLPPFLRATVDLVVDAANAIWAVSGGIVFEGSTADGNHTTLQAANPTAPRTATIPDASGTIAYQEDLLPASGVFRTAADSAAVDETLSDWGAIDQDDTNEGRVMPRHASNCQANATVAGMECYDTTQKVAYIGDGTMPRPTGGTPGGKAVLPAYTPYGGLYQQECDPTYGCSDPAGAIVLNLWPYWVATAPGQRHDANASMWSNPTDSPDAADDFIRDFGVSASISGSGTQYAQFFTAGDDVTDRYFCRCNSSPFAQSTNDSCGAGTSTSIISSTHPESIVIKDESTGRYALMGASSYNGCNSASHTVTIQQRIPFAVAAGDTVQLAMPDGVHADGYYYRFVAQKLIELRWEEAFAPRKNMVPNGYFESGTTSWTSVGSSSGINPTSGFDPTGGANNNNFMGAAVFQHNSGRSAGDSLRSAAITVAPGRSYTGRAIVKFQASNVAAHPQLRPLDGTSNAPLASSEYQVWWFNGYAEVALTDGEVPTECYMPCLLIFKVKPATSTSIKIDIAGLVGTTTNLVIDEVVMFPSLHNDLALHYVFPDVGDQSWYLHTDSRGVDSSSPSGLAERLPKAFDTMKALLRPNWTMARTMQRSTTANAGLSLADVITAGFPGWGAYKPQFSLMHLGVNGATTYTKANVVAAISAAKKAGAIPVILLEPPYRGDITGNDPANACGASTNCAVYMMGVARQILQEGVGN